MKLRTLTVFIDPGWPVLEERIAAAGQFAAGAKAAFEEAGLEVQTIRLATPPFPELLGPDNATQAVQLAQDLEAAAFVTGIEFISLGPVGPEGDAAFVEIIPDIAAATQTVFTAQSVAQPAGGISLLAVRQAAQVIRRIANVGQDGFAGLRFAALANVPAGVPFFPAAYAGDRQNAFAVGTEAADVFVSALDKARTLAEARASIVQQVEDGAKRITAVAKKLSASGAFRFDGIDFSTAPFPDDARSLGRAFERLGVPRVGLHGSLAAAAFVAEALDRAQFQRTGFCGLFLPVLEDSVLAARAADGSLTVNDLLLYSAVCGTGLDTLPLPGDIPADDLAAIILDVASLALRLNKPLTARLMPVPGKKAGDETDWDFEYFAKSRVLAPRSAALGGLLAGVERYQLAEKHAPR
jgi:uncharacterized protein (UPF0210 family)